MDLVSNYHQKLKKQAADSDDYVSEADTTQQSQISDQEVPDYAELMGQDEVQTKGDPKRGRRYFFFNLFMIIVLSMWVMWNSDWRKQYYDGDLLDSVTGSGTNETTSAGTDAAAS